MSRILALIFLLALFMGPGVGLFLVNPSPGETPATVLGLPILYAWTVFWFLVQATVVLIAATTLWSKEDE